MVERHYEFLNGLLGLWRKWEWCLPAAAWAVLGLRIGRLPV